MTSNNDSQKYNEIFDYLSAPSLPTEPESTVVFGRKDPLVALAAGELVMANLAETMVITGGIGKDSGDILSRGYRSEAHYLESELLNDAAIHGYTSKLPKITLDELASNGGENARNSLEILGEQNANTGSMTAVAHATSARRLAAMLKHEAEPVLGQEPKVYIKPSAYEFNSSNPLDQEEARAELLRIADWPAKGWLGVQTEMPENLVDFVRDTSNK